MKVIEPLPGAEIRKTCAQAINLARSSGELVQFDFNGLRMTAAPASTVESMWAYWYELMGKPPALDPTPSGRVVWRFPLITGVSGMGEVEMPVGARILHVAMQGDRITLWAEVDESKRTKRAIRTFWVYPTGYGVMGTHLYVGTCFHGAYVWHIYEAP